MTKTLPFSNDEVIELCDKYPTPLQLYDEGQIREQVRKLYRSFSWCPQPFVNYFAVKATPNPSILRVLVEEGCGMDCSSLAELYLAEFVGCTGSQVMFTSNNTQLNEYKKAMEMDAVVNLDDVSHLEFILAKLGKYPNRLAFRYNPGPSRSGNVIIGNPEEAKFGLTKDQLFEAFRTVKDQGISMLGLHTMIVSNCRDPEEIIATSRMLFELVVEIERACGVTIDLLNLGGGLGLDPLPTDVPLDVVAIGNGVEAEFKKMSDTIKHPIKIVMECGRYITGPGGYLVTRVQHQKNIYKNYLGVDASMVNLMRPSLYGAYHHMTVVPVPDSKLPGDLPYKRSIIDPENLYQPSGITKQKKTGVYDVVGSLCENNDKLAIDRDLGHVRIGDIIVVHDCGAHGHAMGFNYNGKLRAAEYLRKQDPDNTWRYVLIRRMETLADLFSTLTDSPIPARKCILRCAEAHWRMIPKAPLCLAAGLCAAAAAGFRLYSMFRCQRPMKQM